MKRRAVAVLAASLLAASGAFAQTEAPLKIGNLVPLTGPAAGSGQATRVGVELALEEAKYRIAGRPVALITEDYQFKADVALTMTRKLIERDQVNVLLGPLGTHACVAIRSYVAEKGTVWLPTQCTGKELSPPAAAASNMFRASFQYDQLHKIMAKEVFSQLGYKKIVAVGLDYGAGHDETRAFTDAFRQAGGEFETVFMPLGTTDPSPFVAKVSAIKADAIFVNLWGADAPRFIKAAVEYGLTRRTPIFANGTALEDSDTLPAVGRAGIGLLSYRSYSPKIDLAANKAFVAAVLAKTGSVPNQYTYTGYVATKAVIKAIESSGGKSDSATLAAALRKVEIDSPTGQFRFDANQQAVLNLYIRKVAEHGGKLENDLVKMIPNVSATAN